MGNVLKKDISGVVADWMTVYRPRAKVTGREDMRCSTALAYMSVVQMSRLPFFDPWGRCSSRTIAVPSQIVPLMAVAGTLSRPAVRRVMEASSDRYEDPVMLTIDRNETVKVTEAPRWDCRDGLWI